MPGAPDQTALAALGEDGRAEALRRWEVLRAHLEDGVPLTRVAAQSGIPHRTLQRWLARYRAGGLAGLGRAARADRGRSRFPEPLRLLVEGLALRTPAPSAAHVHRQVTAVAEGEGWPVPSYSSVYAIIRGIDPAMATLAHEGSKRYKEVFDLVHRREAAKPNQIWQADHTLLDLWVHHPVRPARPAVADPDRGRPLPRGRRVRGQPRRPVGADHRAGVPAGDLAQALARLARVRHPGARSTSTTARTSPPRTWSR